MDSPEAQPNQTNGNGAASSWDHRVDKIRSGAHAKVDKLSESARPAVDQWSSTAHQAIDKLSDGAAQAAAVLSDKLGNLRGSQGQMAAQTRERVREKPMAAVAVAVAAGFLLSRLLRSRGR